MSCQVGVGYGWGYEYAPFKHPSSNPHDFQHWEDIAGYATAFIRTWSELHEEDTGAKQEIRQGPPIALYESESPVKLTGTALNCNYGSNDTERPLRGM